MRPGQKGALTAKRNPPQQPDLATARLLGAGSVDLTKYDDPRTPLMDWLRSKNNRFFGRAFVNRVWANYFNVGIVNPPDDLSLANPPSNAELLDYLADGFVTHHYDMKWLHREITNSRTYQLSWRPTPTNRLDQRNFSHAIVRRLPAEVAYDAVRQATSSDKTVFAMRSDCSDRAIGSPANRRGRAISPYALSLFGRSVRETNCDCDRSNEPSLLQTVFLRNDSEMLAMISDPRVGWISEMATAIEAARPRVKPGPGKNEARQPAPLKPEQKARQIAQLTERIRQLTEKGETQQVKALTARLEKVKRLPTQAGSAGAPIPALKSSQLPLAKKQELVRTLYLRSLSRYPHEQESNRALAYLDNSESVLKGLRDLVWAVVNTEEFIVNH
jgi:hypothetical protein